MILNSLRNIKHSYTLKIDPFLSYCKTIYFVTTSNTDNIALMSYSSTNERVFILVALLLKILSVDTEISAKYYFLERGKKLFVCFRRC